MGVAIGQHYHFVAAESPVLIYIVFIHAEQFQRETKPVRWES